jgi:glutaminyl-peptide cyclotransferase
MILGTLIGVIFFAAFGSSDKFPVKLNDEQLKFLANALPADYASVVSNKLSLFEPLLIPRQPGSEGHRKAFNYIVAHFQNLDWIVEVDTFSATTPKGVFNFSNIMVSSNPSAKRKLVLAAHYDSKFIEGIEFIGATVFSYFHIRIQQYHVVF